MKKLSLFSLTFLAIASAVAAQPSPPANPWVVNGNAIYYQGCVTVPSSAACEGSGTINGGTVYSGNAQVTTAASPLTSNALILGAGSRGTAALGSLGTGTTVLHGNAGGAPSFGSVSLSADVSGTLGSGSLSGVYGSVTGIGTQTQIDSVNLNAASLQAAQTGTLFQGQGANSTVARSELDAFGAIASFTGVIANGTKASPTFVTNGTQLTGINAYAYNGSSFVGPIVSFRTYAAEDIASGHQGSKACFGTTPVASTTLTDSLCQQASGGITIGSPTGGDKGAGTLNATSVYINGSAIASVTLPANYLSGCVLSTAGSSTTFSIAPCTATDSTNATFMSVGTAYAKTTGAWALGSAAGSLDVGTTGNSLWYNAFEIERVDTSVVDYLTSLAPGTSSTVTITIASPGVVIWANHGLQANAPVKFSTTGALPTGLVAGTQYFVKTVNTTGAFTVSATQGGTEINTSGSQSGTQTALAYPVMPTNYTLFRRLGAMRTNGSAQWNLFSQTGGFVNYGAEVNDNLNTNCVAANTAYALTVPTGVSVAPIFSLRVDYSGSVTNFLVGSGGVQAALTIVPAQSSGEAIAPITSGIWTNPSGQIALNASSTTCQFTTFLLGYYDFRGQ